MVKNEQKGVLLAVAKLFQYNETRPGLMPLKRRMTDPELSAHLKRTFGNKPYFNDISNLRAMYNRGTLTGRKPKRLSRRRNELGAVMDKFARYLLS